MIAFKYPDFWITVHNFQVFPSPSAMSPSLIASKTPAQVSCSVSLAFDFTLINSCSSITFLLNNLPYVLFFYSSQVSGCFIAPSRAKLLSCYASSALAEHVCVLLILFLQTATHPPNLPLPFNFVENHSHHTPSSSWISCLFHSFVLGKEKATQVFS